MKFLLMPVMFLLGLMAILPDKAKALEARVAVASNFMATAKELAAAFEEQSSHELILIPGSTGKHFAQIKNGAPYDMFLAADTDRPERLVKEGINNGSGSAFVYAMGRLVLWSPGKEIDNDFATLLAERNFRYLSIANPRHAPYGMAAQEVLENLGLWTDLQKQLVMGENIAQAYQFVSSGNAQIGLLALSQVFSRAPVKTWVEIPGGFYSPVKQSAVVIRDNEAASAFAQFLQESEARSIIHAYGYDTP